MDHSEEATPSKEQLYVYEVMCEHLGDFNVAVLSENRIRFWCSHNHALAVARACTLTEMLQKDSRCRFLVRNSSPLKGPLASLDVEFVLELGPSPEDFADLLTDMLGDACPDPQDTDRQVLDAKANLGCVGISGALQIFLSFLLVVGLAVGDSAMIGMTIVVAATLMAMGWHSVRWFRSQVKDIVQWGKKKENSRE